MMHFSMGKDIYKLKAKLEAQIKEGRSKIRKLDEDRRKLVEDLNRHVDELDAVNKQIEIEEETGVPASREMTRVESEAPSSFRASTT